MASAPAIPGLALRASLNRPHPASWLATWGPISHKPGGAISARFVVVGMVEQAGTGARAAGPMLKRIWDGLLGATGTPVIPGSQPQTTLPKVAPQVKVTGR